MRLVGVDAWVADLTAALTTELAAGMERSGELVAAEARAHHDYENRTGLLEERTMVGGPVTTTAARVSVPVVADTRYASFIEDGTTRIRPRRFLARALVTSTPAIVGEVNAALAAAGARVSQ